LKTLNTPNTLRIIKPKQGKIVILESAWEVSRVRKKNL